MDLPPLQFDPDREALITPAPPASAAPFPERVVMCFFPEVIEGLADGSGAEVIGRFSRELGGHAIHRVTHRGIPVAIFHPGVGAPLATLHFERAIAAGGRSFVACGGAGALRPDLALGHVVVPDAAVRDEGTSFHYAPPARTVQVDPALVDTAVAVLSARGIPWTVGTTWTTDAPFRETPARVRARSDEGCVTVEMEAAAFLAVARFRDVRFCQYLYAGDDLSGPVWDHRDWSTAGVRGELLRIAIETAAEL
ncbi:nucleoside phosphorylase [Actinomadura algeriensis]|uniref:Uridine phosphorylase n=1 Tax=Actinomadura algeriensis TaxID=1679523 RepID=A0ABR9K0P2_9ACTN|nr:nucleoside phosphorylase [Actinomadura algeriensis]MBE1536393.1 uridine phosphorylase [Actinomadura algeriensis]